MINRMQRNASVPTTLYLKVDIIWNTTQCTRTFFNNAVFQYYDFIHNWGKKI